eukprot:TsM_000662500 transcript=TsM_000662500 gene=TsM_000662500
MTSPTIYKSRLLLRDDSDLNRRRAPVLDKANQRGSPTPATYNQSARLTIHQCIILEKTVVRQSALSSYVPFWNDRALLANRRFGRKRDLQD